MKNKKDMLVDSETLLKMIDFKIPSDNPLYKNHSLKELFYLRVIGCLMTRLNPQQIPNAATFLPLSSIIEDQNSALGWDVLIRASSNEPVLIALVWNKRTSSQDIDPEDA